MNNIDPGLWGNPMWITLYSIALSYPERPSVDQINAATQYFVALKHLIPCEECKSEYAKLLLKHKIELSIRNRNDLCMWVNRIHNEINTKLKKQPIPLIVVKQYFENPSQSENPFMLFSQNLKRKTGCTNCTK